MTEHPTSGEHPMSSGRAPKCTKRRQDGSPCRANAVRGLDACKNHVGMRTDVAKAKGEALTAWRAIVGGDVLVDPAQAVLGMLQMSWLRAGLYAQLLEAQVGEEGGTPDDVEDLADGVPGSTGGLIGHNYGAAAEVGVYATGEAARGLVVLEAAERDRVVRFAKVAHDMGIAEAQIRLAEQQGQLLAGGLSWWLERRGLANDPAARADLAVMLRALGEGRVPIAGEVVT